VSRSDLPLTSFRRGIPKIRERAEMAAEGRDEALIPYDDTSRVLRLRPAVVEFLPDRIAETPRAFPRVDRTKRRTMNASCLSWRILKGLPRDPAIRSRVAREQREECKKSRRRAVMDAGCMVRGANLRRCAPVDLITLISGQRGEYFPLEVLCNSNS